MHALGQQRDAAGEERRPERRRRGLHCAGGRRLLGRRSRRSRLLLLLRREGARRGGLERGDLCEGDLTRSKTALSISLLRFLHEPRIPPKIDQNPPVSHRKSINKIQVHNPTDRGPLRLRGAVPVERRLDRFLRKRRLSAENENCTGLAQVASLGPTL